MMATRLFALPCYYQMCSFMVLPCGDDQAFFSGAALHNEDIGLA
jgi:hypothetical protein